MAIRICITGGIGSGKSVVTGMLLAMGFPVYDTDSNAKRLTSSDPKIREGLISLVGEDVFAGETLNRKRLAAYLFSSAEHARQVNAIIHPRLMADFEQWCRLHDDEGILVAESAILYESGFIKCVDKGVMVYAPLELRLERAMLRDKSSREQILERMSQQMDDERKAELSDYVIVNDGSRALLPQVIKLLASLRE